MEDKRDGQAPEQEDGTARAATAARTRPIDAPADTPSDAVTARAASEAAGDAVDEMRARGFGSHKGTEAD